MGTYPLRPSTKQSGLKAPANTTFTEYMDTAAEVMDTAANAVKAPKPSDADTQVGSEGVKARTPDGFFDLDTGLTIWD